MQVHAKLKERTDEQMKITDLAVISLVNGNVSKDSLNNSKSFQMCNSQSDVLDYFQ